jgi:hypothetical protein
MLLTSSLIWCQTANYLNYGLYKVLVENTITSITATLQSHLISLVGQECDCVQGLIELLIIKFPTNLN